MKFVFSFLLFFIPYIFFAQTGTVNFNIIEGEVPNKMFGLNIWDGTANNINNDLLYKSAIADLNLSIVRFHAFEMTQNTNQKSWYNTTTQQWRTSVIDGCLQAQNAQNKFISIFNFPQWLSYDGVNVKKMDVSNAEVYADWCANLVQITNVQLGHNVKYWTIFNELESNYNTNIQDLATIYLACYTKMKLIDPTIKIGAFAITQPWWNNTAQYNFYQITKDNLDFIDYHLYGREFSSGTNDLLYNDANYLGYGGIDNVRNQATSAGVSLSVPIWLSETNIVWSYNNDPEGKMASNVGAVWDALLFESAIKTKSIESVMLFNDRDGSYGKLSSNNIKRPAYQNLKILSNNFYGSFVNSISTDSDIKILATKNGTNFSVMIINRGLTNKNVSLSFNNGPSSGTVYTKFDLKNTLVQNNSVWTNFNTITVASESITYLLFGTTLSNENFTNTNFDVSLENSIIKSKLINIKSSIDFKGTLSLYDVSGRKIFINKNQSIFNGHNEISISDYNLSKGFYFLNVSNADLASTTFKIFIEN